MCGISGPCWCREQIKIIKNLDVVDLGSTALTKFVVISPFPHSSGFEWDATFVA